MELAENKQPAVKSLLKFKSFCILMIASAISKFGDSLDTIAYSIMVYQITGSKLMLGTLMAVNAIPTIVLTPFTGVLADRFPKKRLILIGYIGRGILVTLTAFLFLTGVLVPWQLYVLTICNASFQALSSPAMSSIIPILISKEALMEGTSYATSVGSIAQFIGSASAGVIIGLCGVFTAVFVDGMTFFIAAAMVIFIKVSGEELLKSSGGVKEYLKDIKEGIKYVVKSYVIIRMIAAFAIVNFCLSPINVLETPFVYEKLKAGSEILSLLSVMLTLGMIIGGVVAANIGKKFKFIHIVAGGLIIFGVFFTLLFMPGNIISSRIVSIGFTVMIYFVIGFCIPIMTSPLGVIVVNNTPKNMFGRVNSVLNMVSMSTVPLGAAVTGVMSEYISMSVLFIIFGVIMLLSSVLLLVDKRLADI